MATATPETPAGTLHDVPWDLYLRLRELPRNRHFRMTYHDGDLILVSPEYIHDRNIWRLEKVVEETAVSRRIEVAGAGTTTLRRRRPGTTAGDAKEPDASYYLGENEALLRRKREIDLDVDPPPDLAIEVDDKSDSSLALPTYAGLLVPELWRYDARAQSLWFGRLAGDDYESIDRSLCLPMLTPALVLFAIGKADEMGGASWILWLRDWATTLPPLANP